jgi:O-antigen/teichoic acid export membrane protein
MSEMNPSGHAGLRSELACYFTAAVLPMGVSVIGMAWVLRLVPPADFGLFNLVSATASIVATGAFHWLCQWILRNGTQFVTPENRTAYWTVLWRAAAAAGGLLTVAGLLVTAMRPGLASLVGAMLLLCLALAAQGMLTAVLQGSGRARQYTMVLAVSTLLRWICTILLCYFWKGSASLWWTLLWGQLIGQVAATALALGSLRGQVSFRLLGPNQRPMELRALSYGAPFLVWAVSMQLLNVADRYVIASLRDAHDVGVYSAVYNLANAAVMAFTNPVLLAFTPQIFSRAGAAAGGLDSSAGVRHLTEKGLQLLIMLGTPLLSFSLLLRNDIVTLILGPEYRAAAMIFPLVVCGILLWQVAQIYQKGFETAARTRTIGISILWAVIVNLLINFLLVPRWGMVGAAAATIAAYVCYLVLVAIRVRSYGRPDLRMRTALSVLLASGMSCAVFVLANGWLRAPWMRLTWGSVCGVVYLGLLVIFCEPLLLSQVRRIQVALDLR